MLRKVIVIAVALFAALPVFAVTIGELQPGGGTVASRGGTLAPLTIISFARPALESGSVDRATVIWTGASTAGCEDAFKIKFFRVSQESGVQVLAERGPFDAALGINNVTLTPAVSIQAGDLIGITQLEPVSCGGVANRRSDQNEAWAAVASDPTSGAVNNIEYNFGLVPSLRASSEASPVHGYLPVVGSAQGSFGSLFKTAIQLTNRGNTRITGRLVFHRTGTSAASSDPDVTFTLDPQQTISSSDTVAATGGTGIGSMDVVSTNGSYPPDITTRIYNDAGADGTSGFTEEVMTAYQAMYQFQRGSLAIPDDVANFRMNIGVRTLGDGVTIAAAQYNKDGAQVGSTVRRTYPENFFEQLTASQFLNDAELSPGGMVLLQIEDGSAFVYESVTDNRTNDSAIRFPVKY